MERLKRVGLKESFESLAVIHRQAVLYALFKNYNISVDCKIHKVTIQDLTPILCFVHERYGLNNMKATDREPVVTRSGKKDSKKIIMFVLFFYSLLLYYLSRKGNEAGTFGLREGE